MGDAAAAAPAAPPPLDGSPDLHIATSSYRLSVSNAAGYLCRITCEATFPVPPATLFRVLTNERNTGVFRDIKDVASRTVLSEGGGVRVVEVEQVRERGGGVEGRERGCPRGGGGARGPNPRAPRGGGGGGARCPNRRPPRCAANRRPPRFPPNRSAKSASSSAPCPLSPTCA